MDYETVIREQFDSMDLSGLNSLMKESISSGGLFGNMTAEDIAYSMLNGEPLFDSGKII